MTYQALPCRRVLIAGLLPCLLPGVALAQTTGSLSLPDPGPVAAAPGRNDSTPVGISSLRLPEGDTFGTSPARGGAVSGRTVTSRRRSDYDPVGVRVGSFRLRPEVEFRAGYDGNVYAQPNGVSDAYGLVRGAASLDSNWSRHALTLDGFVSDLAYASSSTESGPTYRVHGLGRLDLGSQSTLALDLNQERVFLRRGATAEVLPTRRPTTYQLSSAGLDYQRRFNRLRAGVSGYVGHFNYANNETPAGEPLNFSYRDYDLYRGRIELGYQTGAGPEFFLSATGDLRRFRVARPPLIRDSDAVEVLGGIGGEITPLLRGRIGLGYVRIDFKDPAIAARGRFSFDADLDYLLTELTTVKLGARRYFSNVSSINAPSGLSTEILVGADHELLRNVILSAGGTYRQTDYIATDTRSRNWGLNAGGRWLINRQLRTDFAIAYRDRKGRPRAVPVDFAEVEGSVGITFAL